MRSLDDPQLMREIIMDHYQHPRNRGLVDDSSYTKVNMNSDTCIDNLDIQVKFDGDIISDVRYDGEACAICTSSTSIMIDTIIGKTIEEAQEILNNFQNMIDEKEYNEDVLETAIVYDDVKNLANRKKCALLPWWGLEKVIKKVGK